MLLARGVSRSHVSLDANDGVDSLGLGFFPECVGAAHGSVVSDCNGRHLKFGCGGDQLLGLGGTVQHRVIGMDVKVHELVVFCCHFNTIPA